VTESAPDTTVYDLKKHYAVDLGARGRVLPIRKTEVTTRLIGQCKETVTEVPRVDGPPRRMRCYVAEGAVAALLAPYIDSKRLR
jgi:hypothetical protein